MSFNFKAAITICSDFGAPKNKVWHCFHCFPIYLHEVVGPDAMILVFRMFSFKPTIWLQLHVESEKGEITDRTDWWCQRWEVSKMGESESKRREWKSWLKINIQNTKIMASSLINSWQIDGKTTEAMREFISWVPKSLQMVIAALKSKDNSILEEELWPT